MYVIAECTRMLVFLTAISGSMMLATSVGCDNKKYDPPEPEAEVDVDVPGVNVEVHERPGSDVQVDAPGVDVDVDR